MQNIYDLVSIEFILLQITFRYCLLKVPDNFAAYSKAYIYIILFPVHSTKDMEITFINICYCKHVMWLHVWLIDVLSYWCCLPKYLFVIYPILTRKSPFASNLNIIKYIVRKFIPNSSNVRTRLYFNTDI